MTSLTPGEIALATTGFEHAAQTIAAGEQMTALIAESMAERADLDWARRRETGLLAPVVRLPRAKTITMAGVPVREIEPLGPVRGTYLHVHGGGWTIGSHEGQDERLAQLADDTGARVLSVGYRMAPEHVFPAAVDDVAAVAAELVGRSGPRVIGGEAAGAHLAVLALLRLRDAAGRDAAGRDATASTPDGATGFAAAVLTFGAFDLAGSPSRGTPFGGTAEL